MFDFSTMESLLGSFDEKRLRSIFEPVIVGVPPADAGTNLCVLQDGEIRVYGAEGKKRDFPGNRIYLSSRDCGLSWKVFPESPYALGKSVKSPYSGRYLAVVHTKPGNWPANAPNGSEIQAVMSDGGPPSTELTWRDIPGERYGDIRTPVPLRTRKRWIVPAQGQTNSNGDISNQPILLISDDDGDTWHTVRLKPAPRHEIVFPHKGYRWQNGSCEPTLVELTNGTLLLIARTSQDYHYQYFSYDGGNTWTDPEPSSFHGTLTMPTLCRMSNGRIVFLWCNTQPLPELRHEDQWPQLEPWEVSGERGEDVFTNRDANHAAISDDDGKTWAGFREIWLNPIRNDADFRTKGSSDDSLDKSVHQIGALELPFGKLLLEFGQHPSSRKLAIFDPDWLYEKSREEDFRHGMGNLSTHVYLKSVSGNFRGFSGHCAWNRTNGAILAPDPDGNFEEALLISRVSDKRLFSEVQGAVWNFPAAHNGEITIRLRIEGEGIRLSLTDRWFNPIDVTIKDFARFTFTVDKKNLPAGEWVDIKIAWKGNSAEVIWNDKIIGETLSQAESAHGMSYLHMQSLAEEADLGTLIKKLKMESIPAIPYTRRG